MISGVLFDFNGTLFNDSAIHREIWKEIYNEISNNKEDFDEVIAHVFGATNEIIINYMYEHLNKSISIEDNAELSLKKEAMYRQYSIEHDLCHLINGADMVMDYIKDRLPMNLASASIDVNVDFFFSEFNVGQWFNRKLVTNDNGIYKSKIEMYQGAASNIGVDVKDCVIFEDSNYGIQNAYDAGCRNIIVIDPIGDKVKRPGVIQIVKDYTEVDLSIFNNNR